MNTEQEYKDPLADLFKQLPEEPLPAFFRTKVMQQVVLEAAKAKRRSERISLLCVIVASLFILALGALAFIYMGLPRINIPKLDPAGFHFYLFIGGLTLILLYLDYWLRRLFRKEE